MQKAALHKSDILYGEIPVFYFNSNNNKYEHYYANGKHTLEYEQEHVENGDKWILVEIDRVNGQYNKIKGDW